MRWPEQQSRGAELQLRAAWLLCLALGLGALATAGQPSDPRALLEQLNQVSLDPTQIYVLRHAQITRDRIKIYFDRGFLGFLTPVGGETTGAVFSGEGEILLIPPDRVEKRNLAQLTRAPILEERFNSIFLRFTDRTAAELLAAARRPDPEDPEQPGGFEAEWRPVIRDLARSDSARIFQDLLGDRGLAYFRAQIRGLSLGVFEAIDDERLPEAVMVGAVRRNGGKVFGDVWCSMPSQASAARLEPLQVGAARVLSYKIDTRINDDHRLEGRAELELESRSALDRVLTFELSRRLSLLQVTDERSQPLVAFQSPSLEESEAAARGNEWVEVVSPAARPPGERFRLTLTYQGNVIADVGNGVLYVGAHGSWYPNRGASQRAAYDLTFHYPERLTLVATGSRVGETSSHGWKESHWVSDGSFPVAGFNLGEYESRQKRAGSSTIEVYAAHGAETSLERRYKAAVSKNAGVGPSESGEISPRLPPPVSALVPSALLDDVAEAASRALEYFPTLFGRFPYPRLAISQVPGSFAQGWPELVYLPTLSFLAPPEQSELARSERREPPPGEITLAHEIAHQWWGDHLGWKTYHDQWLSEGFASYAAALYVAHQQDGERNLAELLDGYKHDLLQKTDAGRTVESGGPVWLGARLSNSLNPDGYTNIVYKKACWILHMLRLLLTDPVTGSDEKFFKMLGDFAAAYAGRNPSTEDFIRHAEKYMTASSDLAHNGRLDWFFSEWVYGTGIPTYQLQSSVRRLGSGQYGIEGSIESSEVGEDFEMLVPLSTTDSKGRKVTLGLAVVTDAGGTFRFTTATQPGSVTIDEERVLAVVK